jgi:multidrug efflux pump subunit AcrA (membrane-fusion protein)
MGMIRWWLTVTVVLVTGCTTSGGGDPQVQQGKAGRPAVSGGGGDPRVQVVQAARLAAHVDVFGLVEPTNGVGPTDGVDMYVRVEGESKVQMILPEGTRVTRGQLVCELDSSALQNNLKNQRIATLGAEAAYQQARLTHEVAQQALASQEKGLGPQQRTSLAGELALRQSELRDAEFRRDQLQAVLKELGKTPSAGGEKRTPAELVVAVDLQNRLDVAVMGVEQAKAAIVQARTRLETFEKSDGPKKIRELRFDIEKASSDMRAKQATWEREKAKEEKLPRQIANCKLLAPIDGMVSYARAPSPRDEPHAEARTDIAVGTVVRERQHVCGILAPDGPFRVHVKLPPTVVEWLRPGLRARVKVRGLADEALHGWVDFLPSLPDPMNARGDDDLYPIYVRLAKRPPGLDLGMTAEVEIDPDPLEGVLTVPLAAVASFNGADHVAVRKADGGWEARAVLLGLSNGTQAEVRLGLASGETIALDPASALGAGRAPRSSLAPPRPAVKSTPQAPASSSKPSSKRVSKFQTLSPEDRARLRGASPEERIAILRKAGFTEEQSKEISNRMGQSLPATPAGAPP